MPAGRGAAARRAGALPALDHRRGRAARGVGLVEGARAPAADLPGGRRRRRASRRAARTSRRSRSRCGRRSTQAMAEVAADSGLARTGETTWTFGTIEESFTQTRAGHEVQRLPRRWSTRATRRAAGLRLRRRAGGPAPARRAPAAALLVPSPAKRCSTGSTTPPSSGWRGRRTPRSPSWSTTGAAVVGDVVDARDRGARRGGVRRAAGAARAEVEQQRSRDLLLLSVTCSPAGARRTRRSPGGPSCACCPP